MHPLLAIILIAIGLFFWLLNLKNGPNAPYIPLEPRVVQNIVKLAKLKKGDVFYDLGSGDGRLVVAAAMLGAKAYGIETNIFRVIYSRLFIKLFGISDNAKIIKRDLFKQNLSKASVVHVFLLQETNDKLEKKLKKELKKGTKVISFAFKFKTLKLIATYQGVPIYGPIRLYEV